MSADAPEPEPLEQAAESYLARLRAGEHPALTEYVARHPELAADIRELFPALGLMEEGRRCVDRPPEPDLARLAEGQVPQQLGEFRLVSEVGRGGMGVVYEAWQESLGRHVALKVLPYNSLARPEHLERFRREARAAARLHHTNIVPVFGVGEHEGVHYYAMEFIRGQGLDAVLEEVRRMRGHASTSPVKPAQRTTTVAQGMVSGEFKARQGPAEEVPGAALRPDRPEGAAAAPSAGSGTASGLDLHAARPYFASVARIGVQVAEALDYAHGQGVVHRDIKPSNLLVDTAGRVWVTDFGLAKAEGTETLTQAHDILGTPRYMAPERFRGEADRRSDVYGLGITLYELLTLRPAFEPGPYGALAEKIATEEPPRPRRLDPHIPRDLETVVLKATAKEPGRRYASAGELAEDLRRFLDDRPVRARRSGPAARAWRWCRRNPAVAVLSGGVVSLLLAVAVVSLVMAFHIDVARRDAEANAGKERTASVLANANAATALAEKDRAQTLLYGSNMLLFQNAARAGQIGRLREILEQTRAETPAQRGSEWHYLWRTLHREERRFTIHTKVGRGGLNKFSPALTTDGAWASAVQPQDDIRYDVYPQLQRIHWTIWDTATAKPIFRKNLLTPVNSALAYSTSGGVAAIGGHDRVTVWAVRTGRETAVLHFDKVVKSILLDAEGNHLAALASPHGFHISVRYASTDPDPLKGKAPKKGDPGVARAGRYLRVWDLRTRRVVLTEKELGDVLLGWIRFSPDGKWLAAGIIANPEPDDPLEGKRTLTHVLVWDLAARKEVCRLRFPPASAFRFNRDGRTALFVTRTGLEFYALASGQLERRVTVQPVRAIGFHRDGKTFAISDNKGVFAVLGAAGKPVRREEAGHEAPIVAISFRADNRLVTLCEHGMVKVWDLSRSETAVVPTRGQPRLSRELAGPLYAMADSDPTIAAAREVRLSVRRWDDPRPVFTRTLKAGPQQRYRVLSVQQSRDGKRIACALAPSLQPELVPGSLLLMGRFGLVPGLWRWGLEYGNSPIRVEGEPPRWHRVRLLDFLPGPVEFHVWDVASGKELRCLEAPADRKLIHGDYDTSMALSPDGRYCYSGPSDGRLEVWDVDSGQRRQLATGLTSPPWRPAGPRFTPAGRLRSLCVRWPESKTAKPTESSLDHTAPLQLRAHEWDAATGDLTRTWELTVPAEAGVEWNEEDHIELIPGGRYAYYLRGSGTGSGRGAKVRLRVWELGREPQARLVFDGRSTWPIDGSAGTGEIVVFSPDYRRVGVRLDSEFHVWDMTTGRGPVVLRSAPAEEFRFSPDGQRLISVPATTGSGTPGGPRRFKAWESRLWQQVLDAPLTERDKAERGSRYHFDGQRLWHARGRPGAVEITLHDGSSVAEAQLDAAAGDKTAAGGKD
jgi:serine/threonine protein kinase/WD40 repeat protein